MGYLQQEMINMGEHYEGMEQALEKIESLDFEVSELRRLNQALNDMTAKDAVHASVMHAMLDHFHARATERGDVDAIAEAAKYACQDTGIDAESVVDICRSLGYEVDLSDLNTEYRVSMTIPVYLTITVEAPDEETAQEIAPEVVADEGLCNYYLDWDTCNVEIDYVEEAE